jgi:hypothetical protein
MDRSFLSDAQVAEAARRFVCVRIITYEDTEEQKILHAMGGTGSGEVENTVFTILAPDATTKLLRPGRSTRDHFRSAAAMAEALEQISRKYPGRDDSELPPLPKNASVKLAINVAACEGIPVVVLHAKNAETLKTLESRVRRLAWTDEFRGRFVYGIATVTDDLVALDGASEGLSIAQSEQYGRSAKVVAHADASASSLALTLALRNGLEAARPSQVAFFEHIRQGRQQGVLWETLLPITDRMELRARQQGMPPPKR